MKFLLIVSAVVLCIVFLAVFLSYRRNLYLFSEVQGTVTQNGKPVPGVKLHQSVNWAWGQKEFTFETVADADGKFIFHPILAHSFFAGIVPAEIDIKQTLRINHEGANYDGWMYNKSDYNNLSELITGEVSLNLTCELTTKKDHFGDNSPIDAKSSPSEKDTAYGICRIAPPSGTVVE